MQLLRSNPPTLVVPWVAAAVGLGLLLAVARSAQGPLDDPDQAWQRPGFLDAGELPTPAPSVAPGVPGVGRPTVVFFARYGVPLCRALGDHRLGEKAAIAVVVDGMPPAPCAPDVAVVADPQGALAGAYGMRRPRDGGAPVGYAVVDAAGHIRYRTLDPEIVDHLGEVETMLAALA